MGAMASQIFSSRLVSQPLIQAQINENIIASRHCPVMRKMFPFDDVIMSMITTFLTQGAFYKSITNSQIYALKFSLLN